ncbi:MAG: chemotaxis protein CheW [Arenicellales bacterium]|nr:chemotaxis protein CheW [Arenicellales bacterium]
MHDKTEHPVEALWRMQQEARKDGSTPPGQDQDERRWGGLAFQVGENRLVTELTSVVDVLDCPAVTPLPGTQPWLKGVCNVRGNIYSVVDLGVYLGVAPPLAANEGRLMVVNDKELGSTLLVPKIFGLRYFSEQQLQPDTSGLAEVIQPYIKQAFKLDDQLWGVLDLDRLITAKKFLQVESTATSK